MPSSSVPDRAGHGARRENSRSAFCRDAPTRRGPASSRGSPSSPTPQASRAGAAGAEHTTRNKAMKDHNLVEPLSPCEILLERRSARDRDGTSVAGLHNVWITLNNPRELNSYTTTSIKEVILALREASNDRAAVAVVITGAGTQAFCTGGNTREYAEIYAGAPGEYRQYMRLFNDMVSAVLSCDKPVICRVKSMRGPRGPEILPSTTFSLASDLAVFGQAGPRHGSAPDGGSTDFLPLFVGIEHAMHIATLCEPWSAHRFYRLGGLTQIVPALKVDGRYIPNPLVVIDREYDEFGRRVL